MCDINECETGKCEICGKENVILYRAYWHYPIPCECHGPEHFELIRHCSSCVPKEPEYTKVEFKARDIKNPNKLILNIIKHCFKKNNGPNSIYSGWIKYISDIISETLNVSEDDAGKAANAIMERFK